MRLAVDKILKYSVVLRNVFHLPPSPARDEIRNVSLRFALNNIMFPSFSLPARESIVMFFVLRFARSIVMNCLCSCSYFSYGVVCSSIAEEWAYVIKIHTQQIDPPYLETQRQKCEGSVE